MKRFILLALVAFCYSTTFAQQGPTGLQVHEKAPDFTAKDQHGNTINLATALQKGPVVLVFYRGEWCPYCNRYLSQLEEALPQIQAKGATLLAISPEKAESIDKTIGKTKATYSILHDDSLHIMQLYDVAYAVDQKTIDRYKKHGIDFINANGADNGNNLPVPAVYVVNRQGTIVYKFFEPDYTKRADVNEVIDALR